jgi:hypothetical protein
MLVVLKSPIRRLVDWEVADMQMHCLIKDEDIHAAKLFLFRCILSCIIVAIYPILLFRKLRAYYNSIIESRDFYCDPIESEPSWLLGEISKENAEATNMVKIDVCNVPFGYNNVQWRSVLKMMEEGDRLYEFRSPDESWKCFNGKEGVALVRDGEIIADIVILLAP